MGVSIERETDCGSNRKGGTNGGLGKRFERCLWQIQRKSFGAAVEKSKDKRKPVAFFGHRKRAASALIFLIRNSVLLLFFTLLSFQL